MKLRPYQREAIEAVITARRRGVRRMLIALPTGAGKTVIFSELIRLARRGVLVLAHRDELLTQAKAKVEAALRRVGDTRRVEIERGAERASSVAKVVIASLRSLHEGRIGRVLAGRDIHLVIYDECHHAVAERNREVLERIGVFAEDWPGTLVGFTATTRRADGRGLNEVFEEIVCERTLEQMIEAGYLRPLAGLRVETKVDISSVPLEGEDFELDALEDAVDIETRNQLVARSIMELCRDRRTIAFCVGVRHASNLAAALNRQGVRAAIIHGEMPKPDRERTLARFREGHFRVITNVGVLTEGFDDPGVSAVAMVRPLRSESLYLQCVGRGMRLHPSARDCLVLDFVDLSGLDIVTTATLLPGKTRPAPERETTEGEAGPAPQIPVDDDADEAPATLAEITERLCAFDPLTMVQTREAAAISPNAWLSLGTRGMLLHFVDRSGQLCRFELRPRPGRQRGAEIWLDERQLSAAPTMSDAIEAVDFELSNYGDPASARPDAPWRLREITPELEMALRQLRPPRRASNIGEALAHLVLV